MKITILVAEDDSQVKTMYQMMTAAITGEDVEIISAQTVEEVEELINRRFGEIDAAIFNTKIWCRSKETWPLVRLLREKGFDGPIIGTSCIGDKDGKFGSAGADFFCGGVKHEVPEVVAQLLADTSRK